MTIETTFSKPPRLNDRRSIHNADNSATCRRELEAEGWQFVQPWTPPAVDEKLAVLRDNERPNAPDIRPKDMMEALILSKEV
jgi:hypothetical protein